VEEIRQHRTQRAWMMAKCMVCLGTVLCRRTGRKGCDVWWLCVVVMTVERVLQVRLKFA
jgi:hypothetical protein